MSFEDTLLSTRVGRSSTYRCQIGHHEYDSNHFCPHCGAKESPVQARVTRLTLISNPGELARWYDIDRDEFATRLVRDLNVEGRFSKDGLLLYAEVSREKIEKVLSNWIFSD